MPRLNEAEVRDLLGRLYLAAAEERLWPQIIASLRQEQWQPRKTRETSEAADHSSPESALAQASGPYLADAVSQFSYEAGEAPLPRDHLPGSEEQMPFGAPGSEACAVDIPAGCKTLPTAAIASLRVPALAARPDLNLLGSVSAASAPAPPEQDELEQAILQHTFLALKIARKFEDLHDREETLATGLSRLAVGMILIDCDERATAMNEEARAILEKRDLELSGDRLTTADKRARTQLDHLLAGLADTQAGRPTGGGVSIRRKNVHALQIWGVPLRNEERAPRDSRQRPCGLLFVIDPDRAPSMPEHLLMDAFGLTRAETTLTLALVHGETVDEYCDRTGISRNTARTHMRAIFDKFGINKQTELIRLLSGFRLLNMGGRE